jgi:CBS domain containing-hemolysin-like protein
MVLMLDLISKIFTPKESEAAISREEVSAMANVGEEEGVIEENENKIIQNIMKLDNIKAGDVMTPRVVSAIARES